MKSLRYKDIWFETEGLKSLTIQLSQGMYILVGKYENQMSIRLYDFDKKDDAEEALKLLLRSWELLGNGDTYEPDDMDGE